MMIINPRISRKILGAREEDLLKSADQIRVHRKQIKLRDQGNPEDQR